MRVKLFESWNSKTKRYPSRISMDDWSNKKDEWRKGNCEPFSEREREFFKKLILNKKNRKKIYKYFSSNYNVISDVTLDFIHGGYIRYIEIYKMKDSWYLLYDDEEGECYLCDEFEEVEGYLGSKTQLVLE